ncbi:MAG: CarD family transcriptional regulator [Gaiellaceae bacterium]
MKLKVGDVVAYPPHGVGRVAAREKQVVLGTEQEVVVLALSDGLSVTLTVERASEQVRPLVDEKGIRRVQETLREIGDASDDVWAKRLKDAQAKLRGGDPLELAEIVRDGMRREQMSATSGGSKLSASERALVVKARDLLAGEISVVRGVDQEEADAWITEQLTPLG